MTTLIVLGVRPHAAKAACLEAALNCYKNEDFLYYLTYQQKNFIETTLQYDESCGILSKSIRYDADFSYDKIEQDICRTVSDHQVKTIVSIGDTKTSLVAAISAKKSKLTLVNYESGLRSKYNNTIEERIRRKIDAMPDFHLVYNNWCADNIISEGVSPSRIAIVGSSYEDSLVRNLDGSICENGYVVVAVHRKENFRSRPIFGHIFDEARAAGLKIVFIQHPSNYFDNIFKNDDIITLKTQSVRNFIAIMKNASLIITDSAGICEQATLLRKPVLVLRPAIERPWLVRGRTLLTSISNLEVDLKTVLNLESELFDSSTLKTDVSTNIINRLCVFGPKYFS